MRYTYSAFLSTSELDLIASRCPHEVDLNYRPEAVPEALKLGQGVRVRKWHTEATPRSLMRFWKHASDIKN